jgi:general secretion pathway protein J
MAQPLPGPGAREPSGVARSHGFTLVEVLVGLAIMATLAAMAWRGVEGISRSRTISQEAIERTLRLNTVLAQWERDLLELEDTGVVQALTFDGATLRLTRRQDAGVQVVAWTLRSGSWWRWASSATTRVPELRQHWLRSQQLMGDEPGTLRILDASSSVQIYFWRGSSWSNAQSAGDVAVPASPSASGPAAPFREQTPGGVRLVLELAGGTLTRDVVLGPQPP